MVYLKQEIPLNNLQSTMDTFSEALYFLHVEIITKLNLDHYNSIELETLFPSNNLR